MLYRTLFILSLLGLFVSATAEAELRILNSFAVTRHGARTPRNLPANVRWPGSCGVSVADEGFLTALGYDQHCRLGHRQYDRLTAEGILPVNGTFNNSLVAAFSSATSRTLSSASAQLACMFENFTAPLASPAQSGLSYKPHIPIFSNAVEHDAILRPTKSCKLIKEARAHRKVDPAALSIIAAVAGDVTSLANILRIDNATTPAVFVQMAEIITYAEAHQCSDGQLPSSIVERVLKAYNAYAARVDSEFSDELNRSLTAGPFCRELSGRIRHQIHLVHSLSDLTAANQYTLFSAHDSDLIWLLSALDLFTEVYPHGNVLPDYASALMVDVLCPMEPSLVSVSSCRARLVYDATGSSNENNYITLTSWCSEADSAGTCPLATLLDLLDDIAIDQRDWEVICAGGASYPLTPTQTVFAAASVTLFVGVIIYFLLSLCLSRRKSSFSTYNLAY